MDYNRIDAILEDYRARGYYPDAVCHVFNEKETLHVSEIGSAKDNQYFDLASVSKIICTTMILTLVDEGKLTFNTKICELLPNLGEVSRERLKADRPHADDAHLRHRAVVSLLRGWARFLRRA